MAAAGLVRLSREVSRNNSTARQPNLSSQFNGDNPFNQALVFAGLGDKERTLEALDRIPGSARYGY
jgi:hypothetical protein